MSIADLSGFFLPNHQSIGWEDVPGPAPYRRTFELKAEDAATLLAEAAAGGGVAPVKLTLQGNDKPRIFENLWILGPVPPSEPWFGAVEVSDPRWAWDRPHVIGRYNVRRKSGDRRIIQRDSLGNVVVVDDVEYHPATLDNGVPWTARRILEDVFAQMNAQLVTPLQVNLVFEDKFPETSRLENVELDENARTAIARVLSLIAGAQIKIEGNVVTAYNELSGDEASLPEQMGPRIRNHVVEILADYNLVAPSSIKVLFTRDMELRFDFKIDAGATVAGSGPEPRVLENVLPLPDPDLQDFPPGTWVTFDKAFELWGANPVTGAVLSHDFIARQYMNPHFLLGLAEFGQQLAEMSSSQSLWAARAAAILTHYYLTFRLPRKWIDRILRLKAERLALLDSETGSRAKAQAWLNFALRYGSRAQRIAKQVLLARNVTGYADNLSGAGVGQGDVDIVPGGEDLGLIRVTIKTDPYGFAEGAIPAQLTNTPTAEIGNVSGKPRFFAEYKDPGGVAPSLSRSHRIAVILSAIPIVPKGLQQLHAISYTPFDVAARFPQIQGIPFNNAGPVWTIRIPASLETARFAWQDAKANAIEAAFGIRAMDPDALRNALAGLLTNGQSIDSIGAAAAAVIYGGFKPRLIGSRTDSLNDVIRLLGAMRGISHTIRSDGEALSSAQFLDALPARDLLALLPEAVVQAIRQTVK